MRTIVAALAVLCVSVADTAAESWWENIKIKGDLRYRHEMIDAEDQVVRNRQRVRARLGVFGHVSEYTETGVQLATGSADPVSTNQTLGDAFSTKDLRLDLAFLKTTVPRADGLTITAGKFSNPFFAPEKTELLWDSDWNPEGGVASYHVARQKYALTLVSSGLWVEERASDVNSYLVAGQAIARVGDAKTTSVAFGGGYFDYVNIVGFEHFFNGSPAGNTSKRVIESVDSGTGDTTYAQVYDTDFDLLEAFVEITHQINDIPVVLMGDFVTNTAADSVDVGWLLGAAVGKTKNPGSWYLRYIYRVVEKDAVVGTFTDSDFRGGGTDARGHELDGGFQLAKNTTFKISYFLNTIGLEAQESAFRRLQVDLQLKF
jgi:hypothetical protein